MAQEIRIGVIGAHPTRGWAAAAHLPALAALPRFRLAAVATTRMESAVETARRQPGAQAFDDWRRMLADAPLDAVIVAVKVPFHREMVLSAVGAGLHVFCEWPLGLSAAEAAEMHAAAEARGVRHMVGLQSHAHPVLIAARRMIEDGAIGKVISATLAVSLNNWWPDVPASEAYRFDPAFGATGLTVPGGHSLDAFVSVLGPVAEFAAMVAAPHGEAVLTDAGERRAIAAPTQLALIGRLAGGALASLHVRPDVHLPGGIRFDINGTRGDLVIATAPPVGPAPVGIQRAELTLDAALRGERTFRRIEVPEPDIGDAATLVGAARQTARLLRRFADAIETGRPLVPDFGTALDRHRLIEAIVESARSGRAMRG